MAKQMQVKVTAATDFKTYDALTLGEVLTIDKERRRYIHADGDGGFYDDWWLAMMLRNGSFELVVEDDPLPPAPESAMYVNSFNWGVKVTPACGGDLLIATGNPNQWHSGWVGATISADDALQLASDIRRMAMEIKRKERGEQV